MRRNPGHGTAVSLQISPKIYSRRKKEEGRRKKEEAVIAAMVSAIKNVLTVLAVAISNPCRSRKFFTPPQPSPNSRGGSKKFTNDLGLLYVILLLIIAIK